MVETAHYKMLDSVRGLAAQPVLLSHSFALVFSSEFDKAPLVIGWLARLSVILFFVLSGFVISAGIAGEIRKTGRFNWIEYAIRRVARVYPPYLIAIAFVAMLTLWPGLAGRNVNTDGWAWLRAVAFLFTNNDAVTITPVWSLRLEVGLYVFAALAALIVLAAGRLRIALLAVAAALFAIYCSRLAFAGLGAALFGAGAVAAIYFDRLASIRPLWIVAFIAFALALPVAWPVLTDDSTLSLIYQSALGLPLALGLVALAHVTSAGQSPLARLTRASGGWSYTLYIIHVPVVIALTSALTFGPGLGPRLAMLAFCMLTANLVAVAVAWIVERPKACAMLIRRVLMRTNAFAARVRPVPVGNKKPRCQPSKR